MGLFDKLARRKAEAPLTAQEAVGALLYLTIAADGEISEEERDAFVETTTQMKVLRGQSPEQFKLMIDKAQLLLSEHGFDTAIERIATAIPPNLKPTTFTWATEMVFADGKVSDEESEFLTSVYLALGLEEDLALKIIDVIQLKHLG